MPHGTQAKVLLHQCQIYVHPLVSFACHPHSERVSHVVVQTKSISLYHSLPTLHAFSCCFCSSSVHKQHACARVSCDAVINFRYIYIYVYCLHQHADKKKDNIRTISNTLYSINVSHVRASIAIRHALHTLQLIQLPSDNNVCQPDDGQNIYSTALPDFHVSVSLCLSLFLSLAFTKST